MLKKSHYLVFSTVFLRHKINKTKYKHSNRVTVGAAANCFLKAGIVQIYA